MKTGYYYITFDVNKVVLGYSSSIEDYEYYYVDYGSKDNSIEYVFRLKGNQLCLELF